MESCEPLAPGTYIFCEHTLLLDGVIKEVFVGKWFTDPEKQDTRHLYKFPAGSEIDGGKTMCVVTLKRPLSIPEFKGVRRDGIHPIISDTSQNDTITKILVTEDLAATLPNGM